MIMLIVEGKPVSWQRAGRNGKRSFTPPKVKHQEDVIRAVYMNQSGEKLQGAIEAELTFIYEPPKNLSLKKKLELMGQPKLTRPDGDNLAKLVLDALNEVAYPDDSRVYKYTSQKIYGPEAMTIIQLKEK